MTSAVHARASLGHELQADLVVAGGGLGGIAATLAALRQGLRVVLVEELDWLGGQLTAQGVPGEDRSKLLVYLVAPSRKLPKPLSLCVVSRSSGGKSFIVSKSLSLFPPPPH